MNYLQNKRRLADHSRISSTDSKAKTTSFHGLKPSINPLSPKSDQHEISPDNINALAHRVVMRSDDMIREDVSNWYFNKFSPLLYWKSIGTVNENLNFDLRVQRVKTHSRGGPFLTKTNLCLFVRLGYHLFHFNNRGAISRNRKQSCKEEDSPSQAWEPSMNISKMVY